MLLRPEPYRIDNRLVGARFDFKRATRPISPLITFSRASSATYFDSAGVLQTAGSGVARAHAFQDHDPVTLQPLGFLIEEARTNLVLYSEDFTNGVHSPSGVTVSANSVNSPAGTLTADKLEEDTSTGNHRIGQTYAGWSSGVTYTESVFAKAAERTKFQLSLPVTAFTTEQLVTFDLVAKTATTVSGTATGTITELSNGWFRCTITATATTTTAGGLRIYLFDSSNSYTGSSGSGMYFWGWSLEVGSFATSYIATTGSAATRLADSASITGGAFISIWDQSEGTVVVESLRGSAIPAGQFPNIVIASDGTNANRIVLFNYLSGGNKGNFTGDVASITQWNLDSAGTIVGPGTTRKSAGAYKVNDIAFTNNGISPLTDAVATLPAVNALYIGSNNNADGYLNGHIQSLSIYRKRLTNAQIQTLTA